MKMNGWDPVHGQWGLLCCVQNKFWPYANYNLCFWTERYKNNVHVCSYNATL